MKRLGLEFCVGLALAFASVGSTFAQTTVPYAATYYETATGPNCVGNTSCTFTFNPVPILPSVNGSGNAVLFVERVNCRIVVTSPVTAAPAPIGRAELGKTSNATKVFFLPTSTSFYVGNFANPNFSVNLIDQTTQECGVGWFQSQDAARPAGIERRVLGHI